MQIKLKKYLFVMLVAFSFTTVKAGVTSLKEYRDRINLTPGATIMVVEPADVINPTQVLVKRENIVHLVYSRDQLTDLNNGTPWTYTVNYKIYSATNSSSFQLGSLTVSYSATQPVYEDLKVYTAGYTDAVVEIISVSSGIFPKDIRLELETQVTRYYEFSSNSSSCNALFQTMLADVSPGGYLYQSSIYPMSSFWQAVENAMYTPPYLSFYPEEMVSYIADPARFLSSFAYKLVRFHPDYNQYIACSSTFNVFFDQLSNTVNWGFIVGAEEYDLEYVFIDAQDQGVIATLADAFNYKEPTRINTTNNSYQMDMTFPAGKLYFRVRAVGRYLNDTQTNFANLKLGNWNYLDNYTNGYYPITTPFESAHNWQFLNTFAEDGKHKSVISYFDGSFRNRQQQTNLSTNNITVVGETKYDHEGRGVVSILPVPKQNNTLIYESGFNKDLTTGNPFDKTYFDEGVHAKLSTTSGAGQYYSANNPFSNDLYRDYIPNADGYAYSQVEYTRDNTGRISRSSGVGETHKLKDAGSSTPTKESRYFYGTTNSTELHRMFGSNVGKASHYKKNMAIDANGQVSLSYLDQEGRTIATSLAGNSPANLIALESNQPEWVTINLNDNNVIDYNNNISTNSSTILNVTQNTNYSFSYDLTGVIYKSAIPGPSGMPTACIDCVYDLEISITNPDGLKIPLLGVTGGTYDAISKTIKQTFSSPSTTTCPVGYPAGTITFATSFADFGNYTITKTLKISDASLQAELVAAIEEAGLGSSYLAGLIEDAQGSIDWSLCDVTCEQHCLSQVLADNSTLNPNDPTHATIIQGLVDNCVNTTCQQTIDNALAQDECEAIKQVMIVDVSPGGIHQNLWNPSIDIDILIQSHPGYCHYSKCLALNPSKEYDRQQALITIWNDNIAGTASNEAVGNGFDNPISNDPVFSSPLGANILASLTPDYNNYNSGTSNNYPTNLSLINFVDPAQNPNLYTDANIAPADYDKQRWTFFRGFYQQLKIQAIENQYATCPYGTISILQEPQILTTTEDISNSVASGIGNFTADCGDVCTNNVSYWMSLLTQSGCFTAAPTCRTMEENVETLLYNYCVAKCGIDNPFAAIVNDGSAEFTQLQADFAAATSCYSCDLGLITSDPYGSCENTNEIYEVRPYFNVFIDYLNEIALPLANYSYLNTNRYNPTCSIIDNTQYNFHGYFPENMKVVIHYLNGIRLKIPNDINYSSCDLGNLGTVFLSFKDMNLNAFASPDAIKEILSYSLYPGELNLPYDDYPAFKIRAKLVDNSEVDLFMMARNPRYNESWEEISYYRVTRIRDMCIPTSLNCEEFNVTQNQVSSCFENVLNIYNTEVFPTYTGGTGLITLSTTATNSLYNLCNIDDQFLYVPMISEFNFGLWGIHGGCNMINLSLTPVIYNSIDLTRVEKIYNPVYDPNIQVAGMSIVSMTLEEKQSFGGNIYTVYYNNTHNPNNCIDVLLPCSTEFEVNFDDIKNDCVDQLMAEAEYNAIQLYQSQVDAFSSQFIAEYYSKCFAEPFAENLQYEYNSNEYHRTLYYYDQAGNLVQTVPPQGVILLPMDATHFGYGTGGSAVVTGVYSNTPTTQPVHTYITHYAYNSFNQLIKQETPDAGYSNFIYNDKTQLVYSQNAKQKEADKASYTVYDALGRITEVGENSVPVSNNELSLTNIPAPGGMQVTKTYYDDVAIAAVQTEFAAGQQNLRNRVVSTAYYDDFSSGNYVSASHYSYDAHGNVNELVQENNLLANITGPVYKKIAYEYDLISGNVNKVNYQEGKPDQFYHRYCYDADNRILNTETSTNGYIWDNDATYFYYLHGPLARVEIGQDKVQATDYAYTLQGWLKGINSETLLASRDIGKDGQLDNLANLNHNIAKDAYAFQLGYYYGDYASIVNHGTNNFYGDVPAAVTANINLYNGNIASMSTSLTDQNGIPLGAMGYGYKYDQLNRFKWMRAYNNLNITSNSWASLVLLPKYETTVNYDANGNISALNRKGDVTINMDDLSYYYYDKIDGIYNYNETTNEYDYVSGPVPSPSLPEPEMSNRLAYVEDSYGYTTQNDYVGGTLATKYDYDKIGNLTKDPTEAIENIEWTVYGKIKKITRSAINPNNLDDLEFVYDPSGNRITKIVKPQGSTQAGWEYYNYVRDAQGNEMGIYKTTFTGASPNYNAITELAETPIYGSSRLGMKNYVGLLVDNTAFISTTFNSSLFVVSSTTPSTPPTPNTSVLSYSRKLDHKQYELSNHLGNVLSVVSDRKNREYVQLVDDDLFASTLEGWYHTNTLNAANTISVGAGKLNVSTNFLWGGIIKNVVNVTPGKLYRVEFDFELGTGYNGGGFEVWDAAFLNNTPGQWISASGTYSVEYLSTDNTFNIKIWSGRNDGVTANWSIDNVKIIEMGSYVANVQTYTDYYPFGSTMPGRNYNGSDYRYGFQSQEKDDEITGVEGSHVNYKYRMHDTRLGRFFATDPLEKSYPWNSPYAFSENRVIDGVELEGLEWKSTKDKEGVLTGFSWDPDNAYDSDGNLNDGYFETAILFSEKGTEPASGSANSESGFHATATVYKADGTTQDYNSTTLPSNSKLFGTVEEGLYKAKLGTHPMSGGYPALNVFTLGGSRFLPTRDGKPNPSGGGLDGNIYTVDGVNIHKSGRNDYLGTYTRDNKTTGGISEGCFCLQRGSGDALYNDFLGNFSSGQTIGVGLIRGQKPVLNTTNSQMIQFTLPIPELEPIRIDNTYVAPKY